MENVPDAPIPAPERYSASFRLLRDVWVGGVTSRIRRLTFGQRDGRYPDFPSIDVLALHMTQPERAVLRDTRIIPVAVGGSGKRKPGIGVSAHDGPRLSLAEMLRRQGAPIDLLDDAPFTMEGKKAVVGNGVPLAMGRAIARAVRKAVGLPLLEPGVPA